MKKRKQEIPQEKKLFSNKQLITISIALAAIIVLGFLLSRFLLQTQEVKFSLKAAIIDQLGEEFHNSDFNDTGIVANILKNAGFNVSYHRSETVNVTFYKGLAKYNYGIIILRSHSATRKGETIVDFFTSEEFRADKYVSERNNGLLTQGYYSWEEPRKFYFAITPKFIENLEGCFPKSIVIAMGCNSLNATCKEMAEAFIKKGAKAYIGWTGLVQPSHTDDKTIDLLEMLLEKNKTIADAVSTILPDYHFLPQSEMDYYPQKVGSLRISDLIGEAKNSSNHQSAFTLFKPVTTVCVYKFAPEIKRRILNPAC
jgi:hypothetical protein